MCTFFVQLGREEGIVFNLRVNPSSFEAWYGGIVSPRLSLERMEGGTLNTPMNEANQAISSIISQPRQRSGGRLNSSRPVEGSHYQRGSARIINY